MKRKQTVVMAIWLIACILLCGCGGRGGELKASDSVATKLDLAIKYLAESKFDEAILTYQEIIKIDRAVDKAYLGLARTYIIQGKFDEGQKIYQQGLEVLAGNASIPIRLALAGALFDKGDLSGAENTYRDILKLQPDSMDAFQGLLLIFQQKGDAGMGQAVLTEAMQAAPDRYRLYNLIALERVNRWQKDEALEALIKSIAIDVNQNEAFDLLATCFGDQWDAVIDKAGRAADGYAGSMVKFYALSKTARYQEALALYDSVLQGRADNWRARGIAAVACFQMGDKARAQTLAANLQPNEKQPWWISELAVYYILAGDNARAIDLVNSSLAANQMDLALLGAVYPLLSAGDSSAAQTLAVKLLMYNQLPLSYIQQLFLQRGITYPFAGLNNGKLSLDYYVPRLGQRYTFHTLYNNRSGTTTSIWTSTGYHQFRESSLQTVSTPLVVNAYRADNEGIYKLSQELHNDYGTITTSVTSGAQCPVKYVAPGEGWESSYTTRQSNTGTAVNTTDKYIFTGFNKVTIMGKEMEAAHFVCANTWNSGGMSGGGTSENWLVKGLGLVKYQYHYTYSDGGNWEGGGELVSVE